MVLRLLLALIFFCTPAFADSTDRSAEYILNRVFDGTDKLNTSSDHYVDVSSYGAVGDGVTDDSTAIQNAINSLSRSGTVRLGAGTYSLGTTGIVLNGFVKLIGAGREATTLRYTGSGTAILVEDGTGGGGTESHGWIIQDMTIDGRTSGGTPTGAIGLTLGNENGSPKAAIGTVRDVTLKYFTTAGAYLIASEITTFENVYFRYNTGDGLISYVATNNLNTTTVFLNCRFTSNTKRGAYIQQASHFKFIDCTFESNGMEGAWVLRPNDSNVAISNIHFDHCYFENNNTAQSTIYHQLSIDGVSNSLPVIDVNVSNNSFITPGSGDKQLYIGAANANVWFNYYVGQATTAVTTKSTTSSSSFIWDRDDPVTTLSPGASSSIIYHRMNAGEDVTYTNVSGTMTEQTRITSGTFAVSGDLVSTKTTSLGWSVVDQTDNQACNTGCTYACVAGQDLAGANKPLVSCADTTADICLCAGAS